MHQAALMHNVRKTPLESNVSMFALFVFALSPLYRRSIALQRRRLELPGQDTAHQICADQEHNYKARV